MRRPQARWIAIAVLYGLALALMLGLIVAEDDASARTKAIEAAGFVGVPTLVFAAAAAPLWRESRSRLWLAAAGIIAFLVAIPVAVVSWGIALPVSCGLLAVAIADVDRALSLSGFRGSQRGIAFAVVLVVAGALVGLAAPIAALGAVLGLAALAWKLVGTRPRRSVRRS